MYIRHSIKNGFIHILYFTAAHNIYNSKMHTVIHDFKTNQRAILNDYMIEINNKFLIKIHRQPYKFVIYQKKNEANSNN
jgi:hypothetical protein